MKLGKDKEKSAKLETINPEIFYFEDCPRKSVTVTMTICVC